MRVRPEDIRRMAEIQGFQVLDDDLEAMAATLETMRGALDRAYALDLSGIDGPYNFNVSGYRPTGAGVARESNHPSATSELSVSVDPAAPLTRLTIAELSQLIRTRQVSPVEVTQAYLDRIAALDGHLRTYITVTAERAMDDARTAEQEIAAGRYRGPLHGIPIAHKDLIMTKGIRTTYHSKPYVDNVPEQDAEVVSRLAEAGTVMLGKLNTYELGSGDGDIFGLAKNPWNRACQTGGSSSGSGAAVAADLVAGATGTDAGGSIRVPAAFCGVTGLKPTYGWVSRYPEAWSSVSSTGPMTKSALDAALMMQVMTGYDPRHQDSADVPVPNFVSLLGRGLKGLRIGIPSEYFWLPIDGELQDAIEEATKTLVELGASIVPIDLPHADLSELLGAIIVHTECFGKHRKWLVNQPDELGTFFRRVVSVSQFYSANDYLLAQRVRRLMIRDFEAVFDHVDAVLTPTVPYPAFPFGQTHLELRGGSVNPRTGLGRYTRLGNLTGLPALSVPCGFSKGGLPLAFQLMGRAFEDGLLLRIAYAFKEVTEWHRRRPDL
jgi:aspartyl-tRNA(Asn)/glutamyl-tRNA(Gln) amidotransferase subunit A